MVQIKDMEQRISELTLGVKSKDESLAKMVCMYKYTHVYASIQHTYKTT